MKSVFFSLLIIISLSTFAQRDSIFSKDTLNGTTQNVTVKAITPMVQYQLDKTVINVAANINSQGTNIFDVLQKSPGLAVTGQDELVMNGKQGLNVFVDGRPTQLTGRDLAAYLKSLPAESVDKIELIANPSAKYDAQGNAGIINIKMKRNKAFGTNGAINGSYTQNIHYRVNGGLSLNHRQKNLNLFGNYSINNSYQFVQVATNRFVQSNQGTKTFATRQTEQDRYTSQNLRLGADVTLSKRAVVGVLYTRNQINNPTFTPGTTTISGSKIDSILQVESNYNMGSLRQNANFNYRFEDTTGNTLNIDADYTWFGSSTTNPVRNDLFVPGSGLLRTQTVSNGQLNEIDVYSLKADYFHPIKKLGAQVEAGAKATTARTNNYFDAQQLLSGFWKQDTGLSNNFVYNEKVLAAYGTWQGNIKSWQYKLCLRSEYTDVKGASSSLKGTATQQPDTSYFSLFPSAYISYSWKNSANQVKFAYSRRIGRPAYQDLNPFEKHIDQYNIERGNPALRPAFTNNLELSFVFKYAMSATLGYSSTTNVSETGVFSEGNILYAFPQNTVTQNNTYLSLSLPINITKWWSTYTSSTLFYNHYKARLPQGLLNAGSLGLNLYNQQSITTGKGWQLLTEYWGYLPGQQGMFKGKYLGGLSLGVQKKLMKDRAAIRFHFHDILRSQRWAQTVDFGNVTGDTERRWEARGVRLSFNLNFGGTSVKGSRERSTGSEERIKEKSGS
jgi:iron complex outermembrane recepter protein